MRKIFLILSLVLLAGIIVFFMPSKPKSTEYTDGTIKLAGQTVNLDVVTTSAEQMKGLSGRKSIAVNEGMLFVYEKAQIPHFWMKDMNFAIDIVWIHGDKVVDITRDAQPEPGVSDAELKRYLPKEPADKVLELQAGWAEQNGLQIGETVDVSAKF